MGSIPATAHYLKSCYTNYSVLTAKTSGFLKLTTFEPNWLGQVRTKRKVEIFIRRKVLESKKSSLSVLYSTLSCFNVLKWEKKKLSHYEREKINECIPTWMANTQSSSRVSCRQRQEKGPRTCPMRITDLRVSYGSIKEAWYLDI